MPDSNVPPLPAVPGWRVFHSDGGRLWATRETPFPDAALNAGAYRTVDADDPDALRHEIAAQERIAEETRDPGAARRPAEAGRSRRAGAGS